MGTRRRQVHTDNYRLCVAKRLCVFQFCCKISFSRSGEKKWRCFYGCCYACIGRSLLLTVDDTAQWPPTQPTQLTADALKLTLPNGFSILFLPFFVSLCRSNCRSSSSRRLSSGRDSSKTVVALSLNCTHTHTQLNHN